MREGWENHPLTPERAKEMMSMSLEDKLYQTVENIAIWDTFTDGQWYVSFSGGKDSTVLLYIVAKMANNLVHPRPIHVLFCDTGLEYPEIRKFVPWYINWLQEKFPRVTIDYQRRRSKKNFVDVIRNCGYPVIGKEVAQIIYETRKSTPGKYTYYFEKLKGEAKDKNGNPSPYNIPQYEYLLYAPFLVSHKCCDYIKKEPAGTYERKEKRYFVTATMASEGRRRKSEWLRTGCNAFEGKHPRSRPMSFWTEQDVLTYKLQEDIPFCSVYGDVLAYDGENYL